MISRRSAFTLLELALTLAIGLVIFFAAANASSKLLESGAITTSAQMIDDCLAEARQDAQTQNIPVEVRLYAAPAGGYNALQLHWNNPNGTTPAIAPPVVLPGMAAIDATAAHSSLVTTNTAVPAPDSGDPRLNASTRCFHFLPNGATDLAPGTSWTLTVRAAAQADPAHFPANWACITLDPFTGRAQLYRP